MATERTAYSYTRFSDPIQSKGRSEDRQDEGAERWIVENPGHVLEPLKPDRGRSAYHGEHISKGHLGVFLAMAKAGLIKPKSLLLVEALDRIERQDPYTGMGTIRALLDAEIEIVVLQTGRRYTREILATDPMASIEISFTLFTSNQESDKKSKRLKDVWEHKRKAAREGKSVTKNRPAWINPDGSVDQSKANVIRRIFLLASEGKGARTITRQFNLEGVPVIKGAKHWSTGLVKYYLSSRTVIGELQFNRITAKKPAKEGEPVQGFYLPIIDPELWEAVQRQLNGRRKQEVKGIINVKASNLFTRMIWNLYDGSSFFYKEMNKPGKVDGKETIWHTKRLVPTQADNNRPGMMKLNIDYQSFEESFFAFVKEVDVTELFRPGDKSAQATELAQLNADLLEVNERIEDATETYNAAKKETRQRWSTIISDNEEKRQVIIKRIEILRSEMTTSQGIIWEDIKGYLSDPDARHKIAASLRMIIDRINVLPIHTKTAEHRKVEYVLFVEVVFTNGQSRVFVTDQDGTENRQKDISIGFLEGLAWYVMKEGAEHRSWGYTLNAMTSKDRSELLYDLIAKLASSQWRDPLLDWFHRTYPLEVRQSV